MQEVYCVKIPKKEQLEQILVNSKFLLEEHKDMIDKFNFTVNYFKSHGPISNESSNQPTSNTDKNNHRLNSTLPRMKVIRQL